MLCMKTVLHNSFSQGQNYFDMNKKTLPSCVAAPVPSSCSLSLAKLLHMPRWRINNLHKLNVNVLVIATDVIHTLLSVLNVSILFS